LAFFAAVFAGGAYHALVSRGATIAVVAGTTHGIEGTDQSVFFAAATGLAGNGFEIDLSAGTDAIYITGAVFGTWIFVIAFQAQNDNL